MNSGGAEFPMPSPETSRKASVQFFSTHKVWAGPPIYFIIAKTDFDPIVGPSVPFLHTHVSIENAARQSGRSQRILYPVDIKYNTKICPSPLTSESKAGGAMDM